MIQVSPVVRRFGLVDEKDGLIRPYEEPGTASFRETTTLSSRALGEGIRETMGVISCD